MKGYIGSIVDRTTFGFAERLPCGCDLLNGVGIDVEDADVEDDEDEEGDDEDAKGVCVTVDFAALEKKLSDVLDFTT